MDIVAASKGNIYLQNVLLAMQDQITVVAPSAGLNPQASDPSQLTQTPLQPPNWNVVGQDGHFYITIEPLQQNVSAQAGAQNVAAPGGVIPSNAAVVGTVPASINPGIGAPSGPIAGTLFHLESSLNTIFDAAGNVQDYGPALTLSYDITEFPNDVRYWRIRYQTPTSGFTEWFPFVSGSGWIPVSASFLRSTSAAPRAIVNTTNNATIDSIDNGDGTDTIRIYGMAGVGSTFTRFDGQGNQVTMPSGTIGGAAQSTVFIVVWASDTGYRAFPSVSSYTNSLPDKFYPIGANKTVAAGGGGGLNGGGGSSAGGGDGNNTGILFPDLSHT